MITVYSYNVQGHYVGETIAREDHKNPGTYLLPARTTTVPPPVLNDAEVAVWDGNAWDVVPDNRGIWYDWITQAETEIYDVDVPAPDYTTNIEPPQPLWQFNGTAWVRTLATAQEEKRRELFGAYVAARQQTIPYNGRNYEIDEVFVGFLVAALEVQNGMVDVYDAAHDTFQLSQVDAVGLRDAIYSAGLLTVLNREIKLKAVENATDVATVDAIEW